MAKFSKLVGVMVGVMKLIIFIYLWYFQQYIHFDYFYFIKIVTSLEIVLDIQNVYFDIFSLRYKFFQSKHFLKTQKFLNPSEVLLHEFLKELSKDLLKNSKYMSYAVLTTLVHAFPHSFTSNFYRII